MLIPIWRLPNPYLTNVWGCTQQLTQEMVQICVEGWLTRDEPLLVWSDHTDCYVHAGRVAYFVLNGWDDLVEVGVQITDQGERYLHNFDGNHRVAALLFMGFTMVDCVPTKELIEFIGGCYE